MDKLIELELTQEEAQCILDCFNSTAMTGKKLRDMVHGIEDRISKKRQEIENLSKI